MTKQVIVHLVDDLDGEAADETVTFGLDGKVYEIDLSEVHAATLRDRLSSYTSAARRPATTPAGRGRRQDRTDGAGPRSRSEAQTMRSWARDNGLELSARGRIPAAVVHAYREANNATAAAPKPATVAPALRATAGMAETSRSEPTEADVLAWHEAKGYKVPADRAVTGLMRHRYRVAHQATE